MSTVLQALGFRVTVPAGWDVRILGASSGPAGTIDYPLVHAANFALPARREDFGGELVATMTPAQVFVAVLGYGTAGAGQGLFSATGLPHALAPEWFDPYQMQRPVTGKAGVQRFFTEQHRAFCLYAVLGSAAGRAGLVGVINRFLAGVTIQPLAAPASGGAR